MPILSEQVVATSLIGLRFQSPIHLRALLQVEGLLCLFDSLFLFLGWSRYHGRPLPDFEFALLVVEKLVVVNVESHQVGWL